MNIDENIKEFEKTASCIKRKGIDELMDYIRNKTDFYTAPASTQYHLSCEGGLLQHSLNVYDCLTSKFNNMFWAPILENVSLETLTIVSLFHDLCKTNMYVKGTRNQKVYDPERVSKINPRLLKKDSMGYFFWETVMKYEVNDTLPLGHGEKSVIILSQFIKLTEEEIMAIRWHMGFSEEKAQYKFVGDAMEKYPLILALYEADLEACKILEGIDGNKASFENVDGVKFLS